MYYHFTRYYYKHYGKPAISVVHCSPKAFPRYVPKRDVCKTYITHTHTHNHGSFNMHINCKYRVNAHTLVLLEPTRGTVDHTQSLARVTATRSANPSVKLPLPVPGRMPVPIRLLLSRILGNPPVGRVRVVDWCLWHGERTDHGLGSRHTPQLQRNFFY